MIRSVVRAAALPPPHAIDDESFRNICRDFRISESHGQEVREFLDECAACFAQVIKKQRSLPTRRNDRLNIEQAARDIRNAARHLNLATGPAAALGLRAAGERIGPLVSAPWLRSHFSNDPAAPVTRFQDDSTAGSRVPVRPIDVEELSLNDRIYFATHQSRNVIAAILAEIAQALEESRRRIVELPDGRKPLEVRRYLMAALAQLWHQLGRKPTPGGRSKFGQFCEDVFAGFGWPNGGVNAALSDAIATWHRLYR
jgi:hypothetical protein